MDPNENLEQQLALAREIVEAIDAPPWTAAGFGGDSDKWGDEQDRSEWFEALAGQGAGLATAVLALDEWLCKGGFRPDRWRA